ncbi:hypothetical protein BDW22DRAFT_1433702 [Trametopsis cervina]|nr:hypothetical protein BDW22DRAFT_1433702 [Trametopsis cervina]
MPEGPVLKVWAHRMSRRIVKAKQPIQARFIFYPRCFTVGTAAKDYVSCTVEHEADYNPQMDISMDVRHEHTFPSNMDRVRSAKKPWEYLLEGRQPGELVVGVRGKVLAVGAGHYLVLVNFGLEANVMSVTAAQYLAVAARSQDVDGPSQTKSKAKKMRSFLVPDQFKDPQSHRPEETRRLNIFLAIECSDDNVWLFVDHSRLIRFHVISRGKQWTTADVEENSPVSY